MEIRLEDIMFDITTDSIISKKYGSETKDYFAIINKKTGRFLGIKRSTQSLIHNEEFFNNAEKLYDYFTGKKPDLHYVTINEKENWFAVIMGGCPLSDFFYKSSIKKSAGKNNIFSFNDVFASFPHSEERLQELFTRRMHDLQIGFALVNGYDIDYNPNLFLVIISPKENKRLGILPVNRKRFKTNLFDGIEYYHILEDFSKDIIDYISEYYKRFQVPIKGKTLIKSIIFDIHNINLKESVVEYDRKQREEILRFNNIVDSFLENTTADNYSVFSDFILHFYGINRTESPYKIWRTVQENLKIKELYKRSKSRLSKVLLKDEFALKKYEVECEKAYRKAAAVIEKLKEEDKFKKRFK